MCKVENGFIDSSTFIANIWVLKNSKMLFFKQNNVFEFRVRVRNRVGGQFSSGGIALEPT